MENKYKNLLGDCRSGLKYINHCSVDFVIIDPPYGINIMNSDWDNQKIEKLKSKSDVVGSIPVGMKFDPNDAKRLEKFLYPVAKMLLDVLKPGGFCCVFSLARSSHRVAVAFENAGFEVREQIIWDYGQGQCKAQGMQNFIKKAKIDDNIKRTLIKKMNGLKTPQLAPSFETIWLLQKPKNGTFWKNYVEFQVGLVNFRDGVKSVRFSYPKPRNEERESAEGHPTLKPVDLICDLISTFCPEEGVVLDCFAGSGTTGVACIKTNRSFILIEKEEKYYKTIENRLLSASKGKITIENSKIIEKYQ